MFGRLFLTTVLITLLVAAPPLGVLLAFVIVIRGDDDKLI